MTNTQHTPGPWAVKPMGKQLFIESEYPSALTSFVCDMQFPDCQSDEERETAHANAHLIAAAPAMYEALQWAKQYLRMPDFHPDNSYNSEGWARDYNKLIDTISQAEGKP